jgi:hypothetical protein
MSERRIIVMFSCPDCPGIYQAIQRRGEQAGRFNCSRCGALVHQWSGHFELLGWQAVDGARPVRPTAACDVSRATGGGRSSFVKPH